MEFKRHNPASARITGSSVVEDLMIHDIDILLNVFFPEPCNIHSVGNADVMSVLMNCNGIPVSLSASRKASKKIRLFYVEDEEFTIEGNFMTQEVTIHRKPGQYHVEAERYVQENIIEKVMVNTVEPLKRELETFIDCVDRNQPFLIPPEQAIRNLEFCEKISMAQSIRRDPIMTLAELIRKRGPVKKIGVPGMGYVGIPAAVLFADSPAFDFVYGFQRDSPSSGYKIAMLNQGESPLKGEEPGLEALLKKVVTAKKFACTSDFTKITEMDAVTLSIQTPFLNKEAAPERRQGHRAAARRARVRWRHAALCGPRRRDRPRASRRA